ncbi:MAG TPA: OmpH family outer membrane protein [Candidatus Coprenecus stercoravium]|uniref:OmpH family outer membrane protein n=1 Tax=Candidatus Coprenecus stercoravium TaxID=2840735 RepID=A0A9D2GN60_9BACT|nr:OmpH family outer membrane protein [Candidatus Coprenecus stercoravium]
MKRIIVLALGMFSAAAVVTAQDFKFGHINMQEVIYLMDDMDSARVALDQFRMDTEATYNAMVEEFNTKYRTYNEMGASWTPAVLATKQQELQDLQTRIQQYEQNAGADMNNLQQQLMMPIMNKANNAVSKVGKANGLIYVFDVSTGAVPYFDAAQSMDITAQVKAELNISPDKTLPQTPIQ